MQKALGEEDSGWNREQGERCLAGGRRGDRQDYTRLVDHAEKLGWHLQYDGKVFKGLRKEAP